MAGPMRRMAESHGLAELIIQKVNQGDPSRPPRFDFGLLTNKRLPVCGFHPM